MNKVTQILTALEPAILAAKPNGNAEAYRVLNGFFKQKKAECQALLTELKNTPGVIAEDLVDGVKKITGSHP